MRKFFLLLFSAFIAVGAMSQIYAPQYSGPANVANINTTDIQYWVGEGDSEVIFVIIWQDPSNSSNLIPLAWGYKWNSSESKVASDMIFDIANADSRLTITGSTDYIEDFAYTDDTWELEGSAQGWIYTVNTIMAGGIGGQTIESGDVVEFCQVEAAVNWQIPDVTPIPVTDPNGPTVEDATIAAEDILYWVGEGSNQIIFSVNWANPDTALAWGYKFNSDSVTVQQVMNDIKTADFRFDYVPNGQFVNDIIFYGENDTLNIDAGNYWALNVNGLFGTSTFESLWIKNNDFVKWGDATAEGYVVLETSGGYPSKVAWTKAVTPVPVPPAQEATIASENILYWVGEGNNKLILSVNWANPDTALAWGYKFSTDSVTLQQVMDDIKEDDDRFDYTASVPFLNDILFTLENNDTLKITPGKYWSFNVNGYAGKSTFDTMWLKNTDFVKWGDPAATGAVVLDTAPEGWSTRTVWTTRVDPVSIFFHPFTGAVNTEGCEAIAGNSPDFVAWATACSVERGPQDIASNSTPASYGTETEAIGAVVDTADNMSVVSLGDGGKAILTFNGHIYNGEGPDFAVFENGFSDNFLELAFVEVSSDGENFVRFPATSLTQTQTQIGGFGSVDPTMINNLAGKYRRGWGTPFDLEELRDSANIDINNITHVRIIDVIGTIDPTYATYDAWGHIINDPYPTNFNSGGFDLDAVGVIHFASESNVDIIGLEISVYPNPTTGKLICNLNNDKNLNIAIYDMIGRCVKQATVYNSTILDLSDLENGVYMLRAGSQTTKIVVRK